MPQPSNQTPPSDAELISSVSFPSDRLSILSLRRLFPDRFDRFTHGGFGSFFIPTSEPDAYETANSHLLSLAELLNAERIIAEACREDSPLDTDWWREVTIAREVLKDRYQQFGLAAGPGAAEELIRQLEDAGRHLLRSS